MQKHPHCEKIKRQMVISTESSVMPKKRRTFNTSDKLTTNNHSQFFKRKCSDNYSLVSKSNCKKFRHDKVFKCPISNNNRDPTPKRHRKVGKKHGLPSTTVLGASRKSSPGESTSRGNRLEPGIVHQQTATHRRPQHGSART